MAMRRMTLAMGLTVVLALAACGTEADTDALPTSGPTGSTTGSKGTTGKGTTGGTTGKGTTGKGTTGGATTGGATTGASSTTGFRLLGKVSWGM